MNIVIQYDASTAAAPAGFSTAVNYAVAAMDQLIADDLTIKIDFGWGEANGQALSTGAETFRNGNYYTFAATRSALQTHAATSDDAAAVASLPADDPSHGAGFGLPYAQAIALGLKAADSSLVDAEVGLGSQSNFTFDPANRSVPGAYDAIGILEHEITEALGRNSLVNLSGGHESVLDLYRYAAAAARTTADAGGWFSIDGQHLLLPFNNPQNGGDPGDWSPSVSGDAFVEGGTGGHADLVSTVDVRELDVLGYTLLPGSGSGGQFGDAVWEFDGTAASESLAGSADADFIRGMDGNDTVDGGPGADDVNGNQGADIVHGGDGADFVRGGQGSDTVYGDAGADVVNGNLGSDSVYGDDGNDTVYGGQGDDQVFGDGGDDLISGDLGNDTLTGGAGADTFAFRPGAGHDVVTDFNPAEGDRIELPTGTGYTLETVNGNAVIDLGNGDTLTLLGVAQASPDWIVYG